VAKLTEVSDQGGAEGDCDKNNRRIEKGCFLGRSNSVSDIVQVVLFRGPFGILVLLF